MHWLTSICSMFIRRQLTQLFGHNQHDQSTASLSAWSVYHQPVRTNNDCEGWHNRLNAKANHSQLNLYQMIQLLHPEAFLVCINVRLLLKGSAYRIQHASYSRLHSRLAKYWDEYVDSSHSVSRLLSNCRR